MVRRSLLQANSLQEVTRLSAEAVSFVASARLKLRQPDADA
jgi:hypothetical protein